MSGDSSSEHWSFENLTHSIDSAGHPLSATADHTQPKQQQQQQLHQNPPLSLVLRNPYNTNNISSNANGFSVPLGHSSSATIRSPSAGSIYASRLQRQQRNLLSQKQQQQRPDSFSSENFSLSYSEHNSKQHLLYSQASQNSMYATDNTSGPQAPVSPALSGSPGMHPVASIRSDRAVFVPSRQPETSPGLSADGAAGVHALRMCNSASPPLQPQLPPPAAAHMRLSDDTADGRRRQPNSIVPLSGPRGHSAQQGRPRSSSMYPNRKGSSASAAVAPNQRASTSGAPDKMTSAFFPRAAAAAVTASYEQGSDSDPLARKRYDLPPTDDSQALHVASIPQQWQRVRIERDYSQGVTRQFSLTVPAQLGARVDEHRFKRFVRRINIMLREAENSTLRNVAEGCLAFATLYLSTLVIKPHFNKTLDRISSFVDAENKAVFCPAGLMVIDPRQTAFMFIEVLLVT
ncbi:Golgin sub A member 7 [Coemansia sp. RSA 1933]|nr:Golgin sub A member 7 [Coemansia sp. RSA 1933]